MSVAFLSGYYPDRSIVIVDDVGMQWTEMSDNSIRGIEVSTVARTEIPCSFSALTEAEMIALVEFLETNKAEEITWDLDGISYIGHLRGPVTRTMTGNRYTVAFTYYAREDV